jgi:multidrug resistance efflux pump
LKKQDDPMSTSLMTTSDSALPRLRDDLEISRQETADGAVFLIQDPRSGRFCRFRETEHFIATQCNGERSAEDIRERVQQKLQLDFPLETLEMFLQKLGDLGLLAGCEEADIPSRTNGGLLHRRFKLFDPDLFLSRLVDPLGFVFTEAFMVLSTLVIILAGVVALDNSDRLGPELSHVTSPGMVPMIMLAVVGVTLLHELAHGLTCKRFGGRVHDIGFLLLYFLPAFYCDVSSAWAFPEKRKRMWVTFAGVWCNLILWAAAVFVWRITQPDNWIHTGSLLVLAVSGVDTFFNLIPLIKLDGYYLLSDALDAPNLRQNSFAYVGGHIKRFLGGEADNVPQPSDRLKGAYWFYGIAAGLFSSLLLVVLGFRLGGFLMSQFQAIGFLVFTGVLCLIVARPLMRKLRRSGQSTQTDSPNRVRLHWPIRMIVFVALPLTAVMYCPWGLSVMGDVNVTALRTAEIRAQTDGLIEVVYLNEGDAVAGDGEIVRLKNPERESELIQIEAELRKKQAALALLNQGARAEAVALAEARLQTTEILHDHAKRRLEEERDMHQQRLELATASVRAAESRFAFVSADLKRQQTLLEKNIVTTAEIEERQSAVACAEAALDSATARQRELECNQLAELSAEVAMTEAKRDEAQQELTLLTAGPRNEEIQAIQSEIDLLTARKSYLEQMTRYEAVTSSIAGVVVTRHMEELRHRRVQTGDLIAEIQDLKQVRVELSVSEKELGDVQLGRKVDVKVLAYPAESFRGEVVEISPAAKQNETDSVSSHEYIVTTLIDNADGRLRPGMTGKAKVRSGDARVGQVLWRKLSHYIRVEFWSWW